MAKMVTIRGDVLNPLSTGRSIVLPHICNDEGRWGKGFTYKLSQRFAQPEHIYREAAHARELQLGCIQVCDKFANQFYDPNRITTTTTIVNMIAQHGISGNTGLVNPIRPQLRYVALIECMKKVAFQVDRCRDADVHCPRFGSELAGGHWPAIEALIWELWVDQNINVYQYIWEPIPERRGIMSEQTAESAAMFN